MVEPKLEGLPTELLIAILFQIPDLASLKAIVLASPICHQAYVTARRTILSLIVKDQYGVLLGDAVAAVRSYGLDFSRHKHEVIAMLDTWRRREEINKLALTSSSRIDEPVSLEETLNLLYFQKIILFFLEDYATKAPRPSWVEQETWENSILPIELSHTEKHRLSRALCRLQIHANIFERPEYHEDERSQYNEWDRNRETPSPFKSADEEAYRLFFGTMPPWEYEEMGCVWGYFNTKFDPIYEQMSVGLCNLMEKHADKDDELGSKYFEFLPSDVRPPMNTFLSSLRNLEDLDEFSNSLAAMGPEFLYRLLHGIPLVQRDMVMRNALDWGNPFAGMYLLEDDKLPFLYPADRHSVQNYEQLWSTLPAVEQPNLGWKKMHLKPDTPEQTFEWAIDLQGEGQDAWNWGHAIWDAERLKSWKAPILENSQYHEPENAV